MTSGPPVWPDLITSAPRYRLTETVWRMVESQEQIVTRKLVDSLDEHDLLENILEATKPPYRPDSEAYHYLLKTPFRYPPLKWGSRFGRVFEPSLFYASLQVSTALAECGYYRALFWHGMATPPPAGILRTEHTAFTVNLQAEQALYLDAPPFEAFADVLAHPANYTPCQELGSTMREYGIDGFRYLSARCPERGLNAAVFQIHSLKSRYPERSHRWSCEITETEVAFRSRDNLIKFPIEIWRVNDHLPAPA